MDENESVISHLGEMGHHEVVRSWPARIKALALAGGAGVLTAITVAFKMLISHSPLPLALAGLLAALNFVGSFLFMQLLGFKLATKISPLLGAALGRLHLKQIRGHFRRHVKDALHTQFVSALGNLAFVIPSALFFHWLFSLSQARPFLDPESAKAALHSLNPWQGATLLYAALTGCLLWASTHLGGILAFRSRPFSRALATTFFNILLGAFLALVPLFGKWLNIPLDVRHFTLSGGLLVLATASLGLKNALNAGFISAVQGVLFIGVLNFSVSFALGFLMTRDSAASKVSG